VILTLENLAEAAESLHSQTVLRDNSLRGDSLPILASPKTTVQRTEGMPGNEPTVATEVISAPLHWDPPVILLVDDDRSQRLLVCHIARKEGFKVVEAASAEECLALFADVQPDIVMLDAVMPGMDGFSCCERLQQIDQQTPVLIVTALHDQASIDRAFAVGASDYVAKPIHWGVLKQRLYRMVQTKRAMQELRYQSEQERRLIHHIQQLNGVLEEKVEERTAQLNAQVKELQHLDELKNDFICTVSHELRTPLSNIKIALQLMATLLKPELPDHQNLGSQTRLDRYLKIIKDELEREITLVNDLLDWQRLEARIELEPMERIDLRTWLPKVIEPFYNRAQEHHQTLSLDLSPGLPPLPIHPVTLNQIIAELLQNACKYTPATERILVTASAPTYPEDITQLWITVTNTGVEIPSHAMKHIFEKFYRVPNGDPWKHGGTGLGLALLSRRVDLMGGSVKVDSANLATTFTICLPINPAISPKLSS